jgi:hypothetical protein
MPYEARTPAPTALYTQFLRIESQYLPVPYVVQRMGAMESEEGDMRMSVSRREDR